MTSVQQIYVVHFFLTGKALIFAFFNPKKDLP